MDMLGDDNMQLQELYNSDSSLLIFMNKKVDELYNKTVDFSPEIDLQECLTSLHFEQHLSLYTDLEIRLNDLQVIASDRIEPPVGQIINEAPRVTLDLLLSTDQQWQCQNCNRTYNMQKIICQSCALFRPAAFSPNLLHRPMIACEAEIEQFE